MAERLFTTYQVAALLGLSPGSVVDWMQRGQLPFQRLPNGPVRIPEKTLVAFLQAKGIDLEAILAKVVLEERLQRGGAASPTTRAAQAFDAGGSAKSPPAPSASGSLRAQSPLSGQSPVGSASARQLRKELASALLPLLPVDEQIQQAIETVLPKESPPDRLAASVEQPPPPAKVPVAAQVPVAAPPAAASVPAGGDPVSQVAVAILRDAVLRGASAIHFEPRSDGLALRLRVGGAMIDKDNFKARLPHNLAPHLLGYFCDLAKPGPAAVSENSQPLPATAAPRHSGVAQAGAFRLALDGQDVQFDLAAAETRHGRKLVLKVAPLAQPSLADLGLADDDLQWLGSLLSSSSGLVLMAGPASQGRSLLLRAMLRAAHNSTRSAAALGGAAGSRPGEAFKPGASSDNARWDDDIADLPLEGGLELAAALDADLVMLEEIDSPAEARSAVQAAAGSLVLAGVTAADGPAAIELMLQAGASSWALGQGLLAAVGMRRPRLVCAACAKPVPSDGKLLAAMGLPAGEFPQGLGAVGCPRCSHSGYFGSAYVLAPLLPAPQLRALLRQGAGAEAIAQVCRQSPSPAQAGLRALQGGRTTVQELARVLR